MGEGMTVQVKHHLQNHLDEQREHRAVEGYDDPIKTRKVEDVVDIAVHDNADLSDYRYKTRREHYKYPTVSLTHSDGSVEDVEYGTVDVSNVEPVVDVTVIADKMCSVERHEVRFYQCYGVWEETYENNFGQDESYYVLYTDSDDGSPTHHSLNDYRGIIATYPNGNKRFFGDIERHSRDSRHRFDIENAYEPPYSTDDGTFQLKTSNGKIRDATNVVRDTPPSDEDGPTFMINRRSNIPRTAEEIYNAMGPTYTACIKHDSRFGSDVTVSTVKRSLGIWVNTTNHLSDSDRVEALGYPMNAGTYKSPQTHYICDVEDVHSVHVKTPAGEVWTDIENIPELDYNSE